MAAKVSTKVKLNRQRLSRLHRALADGLGAVATEIIKVADPPDATPFGEGLVTTGGTYVSVDGKKVGGTAQKPRGVRAVNPGIMAVAGFGFPGRFQELGTVHHAAQPFLTPAAQRVIPVAPRIMAIFLRSRLRAL